MKIEKFLKTEAKHNKRLKQLLAEGIAIDSLINDFGSLYLSGWEVFYRLAGRYLAPAGDINLEYSDRARKERQFIYRFYELLGEVFYEGREYSHGVEDGIPFVISDFSN